MGRFYKASQGNYADIVADLDTELMLGTLDVHDKAYKKGLDDAGALGEVFKDLKYLKDDNEFVNQRVSDYNKRRDELVNKVSQDPANYVKYNSEIRNLTRDIENDMFNGGLKRASDNYAQEAEITTQINASGASEEAKQNLIRVNALRYQQGGGLAMKDKNNYRSYQEDTNPVKLLDAFDEADFTSALTKNFTFDQTANASAGPGGDYLWKSKESDKFVREEDVESWMNNYMANGDWEAVTTQEVLLELQAKEGDLSLSENSQSVREEVEKRRKSFITQAKIQVGYNQHDEDKSVQANPVEAAAKLALERKNYQPETAKFMDDRSKAPKGVAEQMLKDISDLQYTTGLSETELYNKFSSFNGDLEGLKEYLKSQKNDWRHNMKNTTGAIHLEEFIGGLQSMSVHTSQLVPMPDNPTDADRVINRRENEAVANKVRNYGLSQAQGITLKGSDNSIKVLNDGDGNGKMPGTIAGLVEMGILSMGTNVSGSEVQVQVMKLDNRSGKMVPTWVNKNEISNTSITEGSVINARHDMTGKVDYVNTLNMKVGDKVYTIEATIPGEDIGIVNQDGTIEVTPSKVAGVPKNSGSSINN